MDLQTGSLTRPELTPKQQHDVLTQIDDMIDEQEKKIRDAKNKDEGETDLLTD